MVESGTTSERARSRFTAADERDLRDFMGASTAHVGGLGAIDYGAPYVEGGERSFDPSEQLLANAARYRRTDAIRRALWDDSGGMQRWAVLVLAYGVETEPRPELPASHRKKPWEDGACDRESCRCVDEHGAEVARWRARVEIAQIGVLAPYTRLARERGAEMAVGDQREYTGRKAFASALEALDAEDVRRETHERRFFGPREAFRAHKAGLRGLAYAERMIARLHVPSSRRGMAVAQKVFEAMAKIAAPASLVERYAAECVSRTALLPGWTKVEIRAHAEFMGAVRDDARAMLEDAREHWVEARIGVREAEEIRKACARRAADEVKANRQREDVYLDDVLATVRALAVHAAAKASAESVAAE